MKYTYRTQGTCSQAIEFEIEDGILKNVQFYGGCNGNTQGISALVNGMKLMKYSFVWKASAADSKTPPAPISCAVPYDKPCKNNILRYNFIDITALLNRFKTNEYEETHFFGSNFGTCCHAHHIHQLQKTQG